MTTIREFFANPVVGLVGTLASITSLILAVIFFIASRQAPELVYSVHEPTVLVPSTHPSALSIAYQGQPIQGVDVVAVTVAVWNQGGASIRDSSVLSPVAIVFEPEVRVLEAAALKASRAITGLAVSNDSASFAKGRVGLNWNILEKGDGGNIQIIFAGPSTTRLELTGTIEGQGSPSRLDRFRLPLGLSSRNPAEEYASAKRDRILIPGIMVLSVALIGIRIALRNHGSERFRIVGRFLQPLEGPDVWPAFAITACLFIALAVYLYLRLGSWIPPFGF